MVFLWPVCPAGSGLIRAPREKGRGPASSFYSAKRFQESGGLPVSYYLRAPSVSSRWDSKMICLWSNRFPEKCPKVPPSPDISTERLIKAAYSAISVV